MVLGIFFWRLPNEKSEKLPTQVLFIFGSIYAYILLWLSLHATMQSGDTATMVSLVIYTIIGLIAYARGKMSGNKGVIGYGGAPGVYGRTPALN